MDLKIHLKFFSYCMIWTSFLQVTTLRHLPSEKHPRFIQSCGFSSKQVRCHCRLVRFLQPDIACNLLVNVFRRVPCRLTSRRQRRNSFTVSGKVRNNRWACLRAHPARMCPADRNLLGLTLTSQPELLISAMVGWYAVFKYFLLFQFLTLKL